LISNWTLTHPVVSILINTIHHPNLPFFGTK
jgi:hypothetical protein